MKLTTLLFLLFSVPPVFGAVIYVTPTGAGSMNGSSWTNAFAGAQLQTAIDNANADDQVWVAAGTYRPTTTADRTASFHMKNDLIIYGSFAGNETVIGDRNLSAGLTSILSGEIGAPGIADNSYHVISNVDLLYTAVMDGFIISDANDDRLPTLDEGLGGGIYNDGSGTGNYCNPEFINCIITSNRAVFGAGVFNNGYNDGYCNPHFENCVIADNYATSGGGGVDNFGLGGNASPGFTNCIIYNNTAVNRAGGMYCWAGNDGVSIPQFFNSALINNHAIDGGGIVSDNLNSSTGSSGTSEPMLRNVIMWGNTASGTGPQFFVLGDGEITATFSDIDLTNQSPPHVISGSQLTNIEANPLFVDGFNPQGPDGKWMTADDGFRLQQGSPCIDVGTNAPSPLYDIIGVYRYNSLNPDIGPYEYDPSSAINEQESGRFTTEVYPNPTSGLVEIRGTFPENEPITLSILGIEGKELIEFNGLAVINGQFQVQFDFSPYENGVYLIVLKSSSFFFVNQLIKR